MHTSQKMGWEERTVEVDRLLLLKTLRSNREKHIREYNEAVAGYREQAMAKLEETKAKLLASVERNVESIKAKIEAFDPEESLPDTISLTNITSFTLQVPQSYEDAYNVAIQMAEWEVNKTITLFQSQFQCFVLDDWEWKKSFLHLNKSYGVAAASR